MAKCFVHFGGELRLGGLRILNNLKKYSSDIEFVDNLADCDFAIIHLQYQHDLDFYLHHCNKPFVFLISELNLPKTYFNEFFSNPYLKMIYTFHPLEQLGYKIGSHVLNSWSPWGVDLEVFDANPYEVVNKQRDNNIICFSYYDSEHYQPIYESTRLTNNHMVHLDFRYEYFLRQGKVFDSKHHTYFPDFVSDEKLVELYQSCKYVSGLRSGSGYETVSLEGILNGCRPICFDSIYYRKWFNDFAIFIPEEFDVDMTNNLVKVFSQSDQHKVTVDEINYVRDTFGWKTIAENFWKEVKESVGGF